jgi:hypothetical protein
VPHPPHADLAALIETLLAANVEFIVVGGAAAVLHGAPTTTLDLDIVHSRADANVDRLATVLRELEAVYRDPAGRRIEPTKQDLAGSGQLNLSTKLGPLDPLCQLYDGRGYDELLAHTTVLQDGALRIRLLDLPTLIEIKSSTGRAKDFMIVPLLGALLDDAGE